MHQMFQYFQISTNRIKEYAHNEAKLKSTSGTHDVNLINEIS